MRVLFAVWALFGALLHVGWLPHHALMRGGNLAGAQSSPQAASFVSATLSVIEAASANICRADLSFDRDTPAAPHPAGKTMASSCPVCSLYAAAAISAPDALAGSVWTDPDALRFVVCHETVPATVVAHGLGARGPPTLI